MLVSKNVQIEFADSKMRAVDALHDIREGVRRASFNLSSRYGVEVQTPIVYNGDKVVMEIKIPEKMVTTFSIGPHFKGVATYLLKNCNGHYDQHLVGKRLLFFTEVPTPSASDHRFQLEDRLEAVIQFAKLLERSDEEAMEAINQIRAILKDVENQ